MMTLLICATVPGSFRMLLNTPLSWSDIGLRMLNRLGDSKLEGESPRTVGATETCSHWECSSCC